jgi:hypothetical protein
MSVAPASVFMRELQFKHSYFVNCLNVANEPIVFETRFYLFCCTVHFDYIKVPFTNECTLY